MIGIGSKVRFASMPPDQDSQALVGVTGTVEADGFSGALYVRLDVPVPGHYSGLAWGWPDEFEEIPNVEQS